jgi:uncharacterized protein YndB with AHSA1/START domain
MLIDIALGILALVAVVVGWAIVRPGGFRIARSTTIAAPREAVFALLDDFRAWRRWSPFEQLDPNMTRSYEGPVNGLGAVYAYAGNGKVGQGRFTVCERRPYERLAIRAEFLKPIAATNEIEFWVRPVAGGVAVTWAMSGRQAFLCRLFSLFVSMDRMVGRAFESGLSELKRLSEEARPEPAASWPGRLTA